MSVVRFRLGGQSPAEPPIEVTTTQDPREWDPTVEDPARSGTLRLQPVMTIQPERLEPGPLDRVSILGSIEVRPELLEHQRPREFRRSLYRPADLSSAPAERANSDT